MTTTDLTPLADAAVSALRDIAPDVFDFWDMLDDISPGWRVQLDDAIRRSAPAPLVGTINANDVTVLGDVDTIDL